jgi:TolB-like protein
MGCSTTQDSQTISDVPDSYVQEEKPSGKGFKARIALFPFENFSEDLYALELVMPLVKDQLEAEGFSILDEEKLDRFLLKRRIRSTGYISKKIAEELGQKLQMEAVLVGSINTLDKGKKGKNPRVGLSARLISCSDGSIIWAHHVAATGDDFTGILGLGRVRSLEELAAKMTRRLLDSISMVPPYKEREATYTIAVMPFRNESDIRGAGMVATYMFIVELFKNDNFVPLSYGDIRHLVVHFRVRSKGELDFDKSEAIKDSSGVDGILVGTVEHFDEEKGSVPPEALISARLIDARTGKIVWYDGFHYRGDDGISILDWGRLRSAENVAQEVISKSVKEMSKAKWE